MSVINFQREQKETIQTFRDGDLNLLISTSVAEEGLDIPECNVVIRYGLLTNEIAQQQASGRARAKNSVYSVVAQAGGREMRREKTNEYLEELTGRAIAHVQRMELREFRGKVLHRAFFFFQIKLGNLVCVSESNWFWFHRRFLTFADLRPTEGGSDYTHPRGQAEGYEETQV